MLLLLENGWGKEATTIFPLHKWINLKLIIFCTSQTREGTFSSQVRKLQIFTSYSDIGINFQPSIWKRLL